MSDLLSRLLTPGSGCAAGDGPDCVGVLIHDGPLIERPDGTWSCQVGYVRAKDSILCGCGCREFVHPDEATGLNAELVAAYLDKAIERPSIAAGAIAQRYFRAVSSVDVMIRPQCATEIAGILNASGPKPGHVRLKKIEGWFPLFATVREFQKRRRAAVQYIVVLIEQILRGRFVKRGKVVDDRTPCTTAANGMKCLGDGFDFWGQMPAWSWPDSNNHFGFCQACAKAVAFRFRSSGTLRSLVTGIPDETFDGADAHIDETGPATPLERVQATERLSVRLTEPRWRRVSSAINRLLHKVGEHGITHVDADRIDEQYQRELEAMKEAEEEKDEAQSDQDRARVEARMRKLVESQLRGAGATAEDIAAWADLDSKGLQDKIPELEARRDAQARQKLVERAEHLEMPAETIAAFEGKPLAAIRTEIEAFAAETYGTDRGALDGVPVPAPEEGGIMALAMRRASGAVNRNDPSYGAAREPVPKQGKEKGGGANGKKRQGGRKGLDVGREGPRPPRGSSVLCDIGSRVPVDRVAAAGVVGNPLPSGDQK